MEEDIQKNIAENKISAEKGKMEESKGKNSYLPYIHSDFVALLDVCVVKTPPEKKKKKKLHLPIQEVQEMWVWFLGWEDPLEKETATHSSTLDW